jgi:hypothetical protein
MEQEIINKEVWKWEYFPEKDIRKIKNPSKDGLITKFIVFFMKVLVPEVDFNMNGFYRIRYFEVVNKKNGKVRLLKANEN